jgi:Arc/MetJ-type ribon-helix-helix transcriptional regulator
MKIVSAHIPKSHIRAMEHLVGPNGLYPSRSELVRAAIKEYLIDKLKMIKRAESEDNEEDPESTDPNFVKVPEDNSNGGNGAEKDFKIYKIVKKLKF